MSPRTLAAAGIVLAAAASAVGPETARLATGFAFDEQHTAFPFAPPGFRDVPRSRQEFDGDPLVFDLLASHGMEPVTLEADRHGRVLEYRVEEGGVFPGDALAEASAAFREVHMLAAEAWQAGGEVPAPRLWRVLKGRPAWVRRILRSCGPRTCTVEQLVEGSRFLGITARSLASMDSNHDGGVTRSEFKGAPRTSVHLLGTDGLGRDLLVRLLHGLRMSVVVGLAAAAAAAVVGVAYGTLAGMAGGRVGGLMMRFVDVLYGLPYIFIVILAISVTGPSVLNLLIAIAAVQWLGMARTVRGLVLSIKQAPYVEAARSMGSPPWKLALSHVVPNAGRPIAAWTGLLVPAAIKDEAFLSFLGLGVQAPQASLGTLIAEGALRIADYPWLTAAPAVTLFLLVVLVNAALEAPETATRAGMG